MCSDEASRYQEYISSSMYTVYRRDRRIRTLSSFSLPPSFQPAWSYSQFNIAAAEKPPAVLG